eukprot:271357_1
MIQTNCHHYGGRDQTIRESQTHTNAMDAKADEYNEKTVSLRNAHAKEMAELRQSLYDEKMVELAQKDRVIQHEQQTKEEKHNRGRDNAIKYPNRFKGQSIKEMEADSAQMQCKR